VLREARNLLVVLLSLSFASGGRRDEVKVRLHASKYMGTQGYENSKSYVE
jgi:hypothetical protein